MTETRPRRLTDVVPPPGGLVWVGINPGRRSHQTGHHFAGPGNLFWRLLADAGLTPRLLKPSEDAQLTALGQGLTNVVRRWSPGAEDLTPEEWLQGAQALRRRLRRWNPALVVFLGKQVYASFVSSKKSLPFGLQPVVEGITYAVYVAPNPSARSTVPYAERLQHMQQVALLWAHLAAAPQG